MKIYKNSSVTDSYLHFRDISQVKPPISVCLMTQKCVCPWQVTSKYMFGICMLLKPRLCLLKRGAYYSRLKVQCLYLATHCVPQQHQLMRDQVSMAGYRVYLYCRICMLLLPYVCLWQVIECVYRHLYIAAIITLSIYEKCQSLRGQYHCATFSK